MPYKDINKQKLANHESYIRNKNKVYKRKRLDVKAKKEYINNLKNVPCADCGVLYPPMVMDFDHRDPNTKVDGVANMIQGKGWKLLIEEVKKCEVICANCHRIRTWKRLNKGDSFNGRTAS